MRSRAPLAWFVGPLAAGLVLAWVSGACSAAEITASESLVPASTQLWVSAPNFSEANQSWTKTQLGKLMDDPIMKPFRDDLQKQLRERRAEDDDSLGITWDDVKQIAGGEVCQAIVHPKERRPSRLILIDVSGKLEPAGSILKRLGDDLIKQGATQATEKVGEAAMNVYSKGGKVRLASFLHGNLFCVGRDETVVRYVLERVFKPANDDLRSFVPFQQVNSRVAADNSLIKLDPKAQPHMRWFVQPIGYLEARRVLNPPEEEGTGSKKKLDSLTVARKSGFDALQGAGGWTQFSQGGHDQLHRMAVYAPKPWEKSMPMLSFANEEGLLATDEAWVPADLATHTTCHLELLKAFDHFGPFFDEATTGGKKGTWEKSIRSIRDDPFGPKVDLRAEIMQRLVAAKDGRALGRCTMFTDTLQPVKDNSERQLTAARVRPIAEDYATLGKGPDGNRCGPANATPEQHKQAAEIAERELQEVVRRYFKPDVANDLAIVHANVLPGVDLWELKPEDEDDAKPAKKKPPAVVVAKDGKETKVAVPEVIPQESEAVCVTHGHLLYATHYSLMVKVIHHIRTGGLPLALDADYGTVMENIDAELKRRAWPQCAARRFSRTDEENLLDYELARAGRLRKSNSLLGRILDQGLIPGGSGKPLDYSKLPSYGAVRPYLKPSGALVHSETEGENKDLPGWCGWFVVSFMLQK